MNPTPKPGLNLLTDFTKIERENTLRQVTDAVHHVNKAILRAVDAGMSVELVRHSRYHDSRGNWGDQMTPTIRGYISDGKPPGAPV